VAMARYPALTPRLHEVVEDQLKLLQAIIRGDAQTAQEVAAAHVRNFQVAFQEVMLAGANQPESAAPPAIIGADAAATAHPEPVTTRVAPTFAWPWGRVASCLYRLAERVGFEPTIGLPL